MNQHDMHDEPIPEVANDCYSCQALRGERQISPAPPIYDGRFWRIDHAWPTALVGWVVLVLRRHAEALHQLTAEEFTEMGTLLAHTTQALHAETGCAREYIACFAEADHFSHVHIHVIPRAADLPHSLQGPRIFALLKPDAPELAAVTDVQAFCARMAAALA